MSDYPDPEEEYELMYADDLELLKEQDDHLEPNVCKKKQMPAKRSLDFSSPTPKNVSTKQKTQADPDPPTSSSQISFSQSLPAVDELLTPVNNNNKRTAEDLFGDIGDIDFDNVEMPTKKQKTEEENDMELIDKILEGRRLRQLLLEPSRVQIDAKPKFDAKENLSLNIPKWAFMPLTNSDGDRVYVRLMSENTWDESLDDSSDQPTLQSMFTKTWDEARKLLEKKQEEEQIRQSQEALPDIDTDINGNSLWVEKYRPRSYLELLSEEPVNRALLHWLHLWDKVVFKKEVKTTEPQERNKFVKRTGQFQMTNTWRGRAAEPELGEDGRPALKVALLCGPPGVGKTTLAHLLARIAGYRPVELNASDERSTEAFRTALQSATLMRSVIDAEKRPNCLILDEIDGAPLPTVELLVKWCTATATEGGKKKGKTQPLRRPVIAICNDAYATSLRPLRPVALVIHVGGISQQRLASRLARVCECEGLSVAPHVASALAARARGDVRSAIQVLSFIKARAKAQLKIEDVENAAVGTKDCSKSMMQALTAVFTTNDSDENAIMKTVQAAGEYDRLIDGIFENYLSARVDSRLLLACETLTWLRTYDVINSWTQRTQNYSLYGMLPQCAVRCHRLLASRAPQRMKFPTQAQEMYRKKTEIDSITWSVWRGMAASVAAARRTLRLDVLPLLPYLLAPSLRSANVQLCSESERKTLRTCAGAMCDYGLQYTQQRTPEGVYAFVLEPDVYKVAFIGNEERLKPSPPIRQAIAREQQLEMIRRNEEMTSRVSSKPSSNDSKRKSSENKEGTVSKELKETRLPNHLQRLRPKDVEKSAPQVHKDFFGRIVPLSQVQRSDAVPDVISSSSVFYQYREGFNNAVRRNVRTRDML